MPLGKLSKSQELGVLSHPTMKDFDGVLIKVKKGAARYTTSAKFTNHYELLFKRSNREKIVRHLGEDKPAVVFDFIKIDRKTTK